MALLVNCLAHREFVRLAIFQKKVYGTYVGVERIPMYKSKIVCQFLMYVIIVNEMPAVPCATLIGWEIQEGDRRMGLSN